MGPIIETMLLPQKSKTLVVSYRFHQNFFWILEFSGKNIVFICENKTKQEAKKKYGSKYIQFLEKKNKLKFYNLNKIVKTVNQHKYSIWLRYFPRKFSWKILQKTKKKNISLFEQFFYYYQNKIKKLFKYIFIFVELCILRYFFPGKVYNYLISFPKLTKQLHLKNPSFNSKHIKKKNKQSWILCVARFKKRKNINWLRQIIITKKFQHLKIVGSALNKNDNQEKEKILKEFKIKKTNIEIVKNVPHPHMARFYKKSYLLVLPSIDEPFSLAPLEAASFGVPSLISDSNGLAHAGISAKWLHIFHANSKSHFRKKFNQLLLLK